MPREAVVLGRENLGGGRFAWAGRFGAIRSLFGLLMGAWLRGMKAAAGAVGSGRE